MKKEDLFGAFTKAFGTGGDPRAYFSPGRVNLIGEHVDYNGGPVFPCALTLGTWVVARKRADRVLRMASGNFPLVKEIPLDNLKYLPADDWTNYPKGVLSVMAGKGHRVGGMDLYFHGDLPNGAGLSSSASIELATAVAADDLFGLAVDRVSLVRYSQEAENKFVGVNCGIMDQFAIGMGKKDHAVFLDCATLQYEHVPLALGTAKVVIANTNKRRELADSKYNERRGECEEAAKLMKVKHLVELSPAAFAKRKSQLGSEILLKRARHVVSEIDRTKRAVAVLKAGDLKAFGKLMNESHESLRDDYEVTGKELDSLAAAAWGVGGVLGSRMTGAGFGGCTVSLVEEAAVEAFTREVGERYTAETGLKADFYVAGIGNGTGRRA